MYSKKEESFLREEFWTTFGKYISPVPSAEGCKINWVNYKTGIRFIKLKMEVKGESAYIGFEISHNKIIVQDSFFDHFKLLQVEFEKILMEKWAWEKNIEIENNKISRIYFLLNAVDIYNKDDWPQIISFLKKRILLLDIFWCQHKEIFELIE